MTLFSGLASRCVQTRARGPLTQRVLPISTQAPVDLSALFDSETAEIRKLLNRRKKPRVEIDARLRPLAIVEATIQGRKTQPSKNELRRIEKLLKRDKKWKHLFPGVSQIEISPQGSGASLSLRLTKKSGIPVVLVPEGTPGASVVAVKKVAAAASTISVQRDFPSKVGLSMNKAVAAIRVFEN